MTKSEPWLAPKDRGHGTYMFLEGTKRRHMFVSVCVLADSPEDAKSKKENWK